MTTGDTLATITLHDEPVRLIEQAYANGRMAISAVGADGSSWGTLTVNLPDVALADGEMAIKNWSENAEMAEAAMATGAFVDTGRTIRVNFVAAPVWTLRGRA
jgi:hypothetical protein